VVESLAGLPAPLVLVIAAIVLAAESGLVVGIVLPGATTALGLGLLSRLGVVDFADAVLTVAAATLLGSQLAYLAARRRDPAGFGLLRRARPLLTYAVALLRRHPTVGVAAGRLIGGVRTVTPVMAARAGIRYPRFAAGDVPTALGWAGLLVSLGHLAGTALDEVRLAVGLVGPPAVLAWLIIHVGRKAIRRHAFARSGSIVGR
jgi:membrane-associated protein